MSTNRVPIDDTRVLRQILDNTDALLLDFDGPVCSVFAGKPANAVAGRLRMILKQAGHSQLPDHVVNSADPFDVFRYAATIGENEARQVEAALLASEVEAIASAKPTPGAHSIMREWTATNRPIAIVSNNSEAAIRYYLDEHGITPLVTTVSARTSADPRILKPNSHLVNHAVHQLDKTPQRCTLIGDSTSDIVAAISASVRPIGYANKAHKVIGLARHNAELIITSMEYLRYD